VRARPQQPVTADTAAAHRKFFSRVVLRELADALQPGFDFVGSYESHCFGVNGAGCRPFVTVVYSPGAGVLR
jgi:hypothetical protein